MKSLCEISEVFGTEINVLFQTVRYDIVYTGEGSHLRVIEMYIISRYMVG